MRCEPVARLARLATRRRGHRDSSDIRATVVTPIGAREAANGRPAAVQARAGILYKNSFLIIGIYSCLLLLAFNIFSEYHNMVIFVD